MSKFCLNCGHEMNDADVACVSCGAQYGQAAPVAAPVAPVAAPPMAQNGAPVMAPNGAPVAPNGAPQKEPFNFKQVMSDIGDGFKSVGGSVLAKIREKKTLFIIIGAAVVGVIVLLLILGLLFGGARDKAIENYVFQRYLHDGEVLEDTIPESAWAVIGKAHNDDQDELDMGDYVGFLSTYQEDLNAAKYSEKLGAEVEVKSFKVTEEKEMNESQLKRFKENAKEAYDLSARDITEAYDVTATFTLSGDKDDVDVEIKVVVFKLGGDYYVYDAMTNLNAESWHNSRSITDMVRAEIKDSKGFDESLGKWVENGDAKMKSFDYRSSNASVEIPDVEDYEDAMEDLYDDLYDALS